MIESPDSPELYRLCDELSSLSDFSDWPNEALQRCADAGFYRWFIPKDLGGLGWSTTDIARGYLELSKANLTVTFILTQRVAAIRRIVGSQNESLKQRMIPLLLTGEETATVGISHLTTSRQHLGKPVMSAVEVDGGFQLNGMSPWVTGACGVDWVFMGGCMVDEFGNADGRELLFLARSDSEQIAVKDGFDMIALSASQTGAVTASDLFVPESNVVAGPIENVLTGNGGGAGGLQTSVLALGLASAAIDYIESEAEKRSDLAPTQTSLRSQHANLCRDLFAATGGSKEITAAEIRSQANSLALRATQSALVVAKGAGFVTGHPVGRWCREALFFLVWSCPQEVSQANLDEFAPCS